MNPRFRIALIAGFGSMMILTAILGFSQIRRTTESQFEFAAAQQSYAASEDLLSQIRSDLYRINLDVRDYLLDRDAANAADLKQQVLATRQRILSSLDQLKPRHSASGDADTLEALRNEVEDYIVWLRPPLEWSPEVKNALAGTYTRNVLLRRRSLIGSLSKRLQDINVENLRLAQRRLNDSQRESRYWLRRLTYSVLILSAIVAILSVWWIFRLERRARAAETELRQLSQKLVQTQEAERKALSRELHDQVGQMLTALRVEISNLGRIGSSDPERLQLHVTQAKQVAEGAMKTVRDLAMGLRPSMLDDLGLGAALGWQTREFSRLNGVPANLKLDGPLDSLSEEARTSLFRIVQEALTNITRHAKATRVDISLQANDEMVELKVVDDGGGMDTAAARRTGLGLLGMEERVRELHGELNIESDIGHGTVVRVSIPVLTPKEST
jgi:signal transduction histidine kinase